MKLRFLLIIVCVLATFIDSKAQGVSISVTGAAPDQSAQLDIQSTGKGLLTPRMTASQRQTINSPATGLLIYQTDGAKGFYFNDGTASSPNWVLIGTAIQGDATAATFSIVNLSSSAYLINSPSDYVSGNNANPTLTLRRGLTYKFNISAQGHPFRIASSSFGNAFTVGVSANDVQNGTITFKVPMDAPNTLFYYCIFHSSMNGIININ